MPSAVQQPAGQKSVTFARLMSIDLNQIGFLELFSLFSTILPEIKTYREQLEKRQSTPQLQKKPTITFEMACEFWIQAQLATIQAKYNDNYLDDHPVYSWVNNLFLSHGHFLSLLSLSAHSLELQMTAEALKNENISNRQTKNIIHNTVTAIQQISDFTKELLRRAKNGISERKTAVKAELELSYENLPRKEEIIPGEKRLALKLLLPSPTTHSESILWLYFSLLQIAPTIISGLKNEALLEKLSSLGTSSEYKTQKAREYELLRTEEEKKEAIKELFYSLVQQQTSLNHSVKKQEKIVYQNSVEATNEQKIKFALKTIPQICQNTVFTNADYKVQFLAVMGELALAVNHMPIFSSLTNQHDQMISSINLSPKQLEPLYIEGKISLLLKPPFFKPMMKWLGIGTASLLSGGLILILSATGVLPIMLASAILLAVATALTTFLVSAIFTASHSQFKKQQGLSEALQSASSLSERAAENTRKPGTNTEKIQRSLRIEIEEIAAPQAGPESPNSIAAEYDFGDYENHSPTHSIVENLDLDNSHSHMRNYQ